PSHGDALFCCVKRSASRQNTVAFLLLLEEPDADKTSHSNNVVVWLSLRRMVNLTTRCPTGYKWRKTRHTYRRAISRITTTMRALPVSELNGPFLCPTHLTKEVCLESNQHLCLARQYSHRCVPVFSPHQARWYPLSLYNLRIFLCLMNILLLWVSCLTV
ncbi:hypothetical protein B9C76_23920, partial [Salmonella enterica subsp. enterica serovar Typhimurium]|nr:hypothetical protein [Salmonella enterica subsp. enterica serovar Typhimurium]